MRLGVVALAFCGLLMALIVSDLGTWHIVEGRRQHRSGTAHLHSHETPKLKAHQTRNLVEPPPRCPWCVPCRAPSPWLARKCRPGSEQQGGCWARKSTATLRSEAWEHPSPEFVKLATAHFLGFNSATDHQRSKSFCSPEGISRWYPYAKPEAHTSASVWNTWRRLNFWRCRFWALAKSQCSPGWGRLQFQWADPSRVAPACLHCGYT